MLWFERHQAAYFSSRERKMPRYHFNTLDRGDHRDPDGAELADLAAAQSYAVRYFGELLLGEPWTFADGGEWKMEVTDESGLILFSLHFIGIEAPALERPDLTISVLPPS